MALSATDGSVIGVSFLGGVIVTAGSSFDGARPRVCCSAGGERRCVGANAWCSRAAEHAVTAAGHVRSRDHASALMRYRRVTLMERETASPASLHSISEPLAAVVSVRQQGSAQLTASTLRLPMRGFDAYLLRDVGGRPMRGQEGSLSRGETAARPAGAISLGRPHWRRVDSSCSTAPSAHFRRSRSVDARAFPICRRSTAACLPLGCAVSERYRARSRGTRTRLTI